MRKSYSEVTPYIEELAQRSSQNNNIVPAMYVEHHVNRGLRDMSGNGVVTGLTEVSRIKAKDMDEEGNVIPCKGELYYRGYNVRDLTDSLLREDRYGFEEAVYLLLFSELPGKEPLSRFRQELADLRSLPPCFCFTAVFVVFPLRSAGQSPFVFAFTPQN